MLREADEFAVHMRAFETVVRGYGREVHGEAACVCLCAAPAAPAARLVLPHALASTLVRSGALMLDQHSAASSACGTAVQLAVPAGTCLQVIKDMCADRTHTCKHTNTNAQKHTHKHTRLHVQPAAAAQRQPAAAVEARARY